MVEVVNRRTYRGSDYTYVGRPSPLGNPFTHERGSRHAEQVVASREEAVGRYREWLRNALLHDSRVHAAFMGLVDVYVHFGELKLGCWCHPKPCHAHVIAEMVEEMAERCRKDTSGT